LVRRRIIDDADRKARIAFKQLRGAKIKEVGEDIAIIPLVELAQELGQIVQQGES
jgi:hypothetical protein